MCELYKFLRKLLMATIFIFSSYCYAASFQLWEEDGASLGAYHAGYAAAANDASIAFYNPAGITLFKHQQMVLGLVGVQSNFKYKGTIAVNGLGDIPTYVTSQGGVFDLIPDLHYVAPLSDNLGFGFSIVVPFGLETNYGRDTILKYAGTLSSITIIDFSPDLAWQLNKKSSLGIGIDIQKAFAEFDSIATMFSSINDTESRNKVSDTGYGYHLGGLYQFTSQTRLGLSYHSKVVHYMTGTSKFVGPLNILTDGPLVSNRAYTTITLPPYTALSLIHKIAPNLQLMSSVIFTQWSIFKNLTFNNFAGLAPGGFLGITPSNTIQVTMPEYYRNTFNFSFGAEYAISEKIVLRGGVGYDQTPVKDSYRHVQLPDNNRYAGALGMHYQSSKVLGFDLGWTHLFIHKAVIMPPPQIMGAQIVTTNGNVKGFADVIGLQVTWNML